MSETAPNLTRFRATIQYDGTAFHGSQLQPEVRTVQGELESALSRLLDSHTRVDFAGRTDTGVHALGQEVAFSAPARWDTADLGRGISALVPHDVTVQTPRDAGDGFHPRFDAERRRYLYLVAPGDAGCTPFFRSFAWRTRLEGPDPGSGPETLQRLSRLAAAIVGERDFSGFAKAGQPDRGTRCAVEVAQWHRYGQEQFLFEIVGDRFLHHMVRYLVGTMIEIAADRRPEGDMTALLGAATGSRPVFPAPPGGLYLSGVRYPAGWNRTGELPW